MNRYLTILIGILLCLASCSPIAAPDLPDTPTAALQPTQTSPAAERVSLRVFCAGSLIIPFDDLEKAFESRYPGIDVLNECHGSIQVIRHVTELHERIDIVATADAALLPMLMYTVNDPDTGQPYASWHIRFATNRLALAYASTSQYAAEITPENWFEVLSRPGVRLGIADPRFDASGYRAMMVFFLTQAEYGQPRLFSQMFQDQFTFPVTLFQDDDGAYITIPEILETRPGSRIVIRGASIQLIALLQSGDLDYAFEYESVIQQHGLQMVQFPGALNLGEEAYADQYSQVQVTLDFQRFASLKPEFRGERIAYGITIPSNAPHPQEAALFIAFLLGPEGQAIMQANNQPLFDPVPADHYEQMPPELQALTIPYEAP